MFPERTIHDSSQQQLRQACAELRERLRAGDSCRSEDLLESRPLLSSNPDLAFELILTELTTRRELGQHLEPASWYARFPRWHNQLEQWFRSSGLIFDSVPPEPLTVEQTPVTTDRAPPRPPLRRVRFGRYELLDELGKGAMGVVYRARDPSLGRVVALKTIRGGRLARPEEVERFLQEARAAAKLQHAHVMPLYDFGEEDDQHYLTMALAAGGSLSRKRDLFGGDLRQAAALMEKIARGVQHLHSKGILHRDLKPGNIMLDEQGEPLVSDFGLAKLLDADAELTQQGVIVGTPAYMAPEMSTARPKPATVLTDVWSLGVILYELLTGQRPFSGAGAQDVSENIVLTSPPRPQGLRPGLDPRLETIVLKCLEKEPGRRYASAQELADDLGRWQRDEPIHARPERWPARTWRWLRCRAGVILGVALLGALAVTAAVLLSGRQPPTRSAPTAEQAQARALESVQRDLAAGKARTLVAEGRAPEYYRFVTEKHRPPLGPSGPGPFFLESYSLCLFELLPDPQREAHRISARVNFRTTNEGAAGLYFMGEERLTPRGAEHVFLALTFADQGFLAGKVRLQAFLYRPSQPARPMERQEFTLKDLPLARKEWHDLTVEVRPDSILASCDGKAFPRLNLGQEQKRLAVWWSHIPSVGKAAPPPALAPRSSLGLFVRRGTAQIKSFVITPLPADNPK
jgi:serine/threonine-protein kinase